MKDKKLIYDVAERPPVGKWIILALQHVFAMFGATVLMPILVNQAAGREVMYISTALLASGVGTLLYILCTKAKSPVYLGSSFSFIMPVVAAFSKDGISGVCTGIASVGFIYIIVSFFIKKFGSSWIKKILPPVVVGPMIMIIGLSLAPNAVNQIGLNGGELVWQNIVVALFSFLITVVVAIYGKGFLKVIPFLIGIVSGYVMSIILGIVDFSPINNTDFLSLPHILIPFKDYSFSISGLLTIAPLAFVTISEHVGDHLALSSIIGKDLIKDPGLDKTLLGDGTATFVAGLIGGPANTTYGENTSVVGMSRVASVWVIGLAAIISILLSFMGTITSIFSTIPDPVLGGVSMLLYGFISVNGLKVIVENKIDFNDLRNVIIASTMLILGLGGAIITVESGDLSFSLTGMSLAAIVGILLNLLLKKRKEEKSNG